METVVPYAIWAVLIIAGLGLLMIMLFGIRSLAYGKVSPLSAVAVLLPIIILGALGLATGEWSEAAVWTSVIMMGLGVVSLVLSSIRGAIGI